jgi:hypothetical protein
MQDENPGPLHFSRRVKRLTKRACHAAVAAAVRAGRLVRSPCLECCAPETVAHHDDYAKPLDVLWLCPLHHVARHIERGHVSSQWKGSPQRKSRAERRTEIIGFRLSEAEWARSLAVIQEGESMTKAVRTAFLQEVERRVAAARRVLKQEKEG